jgi:Asp/Glu/hydantoin racemase
VSYGEAIGILLLENFVPFIPGDTANATTYDFPVRFQRVPGLSVEKMFNHDLLMYEKVRTAALELKREGVRAITSDCGFMVIHQQQLAADLDLPVFSSSLLQLSFMDLITGGRKHIGVITANSRSLTNELFSMAGVSSDLMERITVRGLEDYQPFVEAVFEERGELDSDLIETGVVTRAKQLLEEDPDIGSILLECSLLPPYGAAVQEAVGLPVFDFVTMINYVHSTIVKQRFTGSM